MPRIARLGALVAVVGCGSEKSLTAISVFDEVQGGTPSGWLSLGVSSTYLLGLDHVNRHGGNNAVAIVGNDPTSKVFRGLSQSIKADAYRGKRVRFSAWARSQDVVGPQVGLFMRIDGQNLVLGFDGMGGTRSLRGTADWHRMEIVLDVPNEAVGFQLGALMQGSGIALFDDFLLEIVPTSVATTSPATSVASAIDAIAAYATLPTAMVNLDFEK